MFRKGVIIKSMREKMLWVEIKGWSVAFSHDASTYKT